MIIKEARIKAGLTQKQFSDLFDIPLRTIESWEGGARKPPSYVAKLIVEKLEFLSAHQSVPNEPRDEGMPERHELLKRAE